MTALASIAFTVKFVVVDNVDAAVVTLSVDEVVVVAVVVVISVVVLLSLATRLSILFALLLPLSTKRDSSTSLAKVETRGTDLQEHMKIKSARKTKKKRLSIPL